MRWKTLAWDVGGPSQKPPCVSLLLVLVGLTLKVLVLCSEKARLSGPGAGGSGAGIRKQMPIRVCFPPCCFSEVRQTLKSVLPVKSVSRLVSAAVNTNADLFFFRLSFSSIVSFLGRGSELLVSAAVYNCRCVNSNFISLAPPKDKCCSLGLPLEGSPIPKNVNCKLSR